MWKVTDLARRHQLSATTLMYWFWLCVTVGRALFAPVGTFTWYLGIAAALIASSAGGFWLRGLRDERRTTRKES